MQAVSPMTPSKRSQDHMYDDMYPSHPPNLFNPDFPPPHMPEIKRSKPSGSGARDTQKIVNSPSYRGIPAHATPPTTYKIDIPVHAALYSLAVSAHCASAQHLQQVFIPSNIAIRPSNECIPLRVYLPDESSILFRHDTHALKKSVSLLLLALDLLRIGIKSKDLSEREEVAFGLEFGLVAAKIIEVEAIKTDGKGKQAAIIDIDRLKLDGRDAVANAVSSHALRSPC